MSAARVALERFDRAAPAIEAPAPEPEPTPAATPVEPGTPDVDPETKQAPERSDAHALDRAAAALEALEARIGEIRSAAREEAAMACAGAIGRLAPFLARSAFPNEVTQSLARLATQLDGSALELAVAPDDRIAIERALAHAGAAPANLALRESSGLRPGEAQLFWPEGGAEIDAAALVAAAEAALARALDPQETEDLAS